jgi:hypothetical protein
MRQDEVITTCGNCIFADFNEPSPGFAKVQSGCKVNRLERYNANGAKIELVQDGKTGIESYVIKDKICMMKRTQEWFDAHPELHNREFGHVAMTVRNQAAIKFQAFVIANNSLKETGATIHSLRHQTHQPYVALVRKKDNNLPYYKVREMFRGIKEWRIDSIQDEEVQTDRECIDEVFHVMTQPVYMVVHSGCIVPKDAFEQIELKMNDELVEFGVLTGNSEGDGFTVASAIHHYFRGNLDRPIEEKVAEKDPGMVYPIYNLVPNFPK